MHQPIGGLNVSKTPIHNGLVVHDDGIAVANDTNGFVVHQCFVRVAVDHFGRCETTRHLVVPYQLAKVSTKLGILPKVTRDPRHGLVGGSKDGKDLTIEPTTQIPIHQFHRFQQDGKSVVTENIRNRFLLLLCQDRPCLQHQ